MAHVSGQGEQNGSSALHYIAVGCFIYRCDDGKLHQEHQEGWMQLESLWSPPNPHSLIFTDIDRLISEKWIRATYKPSIDDTSMAICRIYVLPHDEAQRSIDRRDRNLTSALERLVQVLDTRTSVWNGRLERSETTRFDLFAKADPSRSSLFYLFNNIPSPKPSTSIVKEPYSHEALEDLLGSDHGIPGLRAHLYPYQRRSAGLMLQREATVLLELDPRLEKRIGPDGGIYYYCPWDVHFLREPRMYESCHGGILAETMGLGKTVICLALILATKHHLPKMPPAYAAPSVRRRVGSLVEMAVTATSRRSIPWQVEFDRIRNASGFVSDGCVAALQADLPTYEVPVVPIRWNRTTRLPPPVTMTLAATTIVVVPSNLYKQWRSEILKHAEKDCLKVLYMDNKKQILPGVAELRSYDVILFSRSRFEAEVNDGADDQGRRIAPVPRVCQCFYKGATRIRDCTCVKEDALYESPLKRIHFKRLIIDEGHFFSNADTRAMSVVNKLVTADCRWVVSGTPAKDLLGVEVESSAHSAASRGDISALRRSILEQKRYFDMKASGERQYSGFSHSLERTLRNVVVRTQASDVEADIVLPPLVHTIVRLKPSFYDKLSANLFALVLIANAVTSERTDADYLFHKSSQKARSQLISNLRQSAFFWTGFSEADIEASIKNSRGYLDKQGTKCSEPDRIRLEEALQTARLVLESATWRGMSRSHELGVFVKDWPVDSAEHWSFSPYQPSRPIVTGLSQLAEAQNLLNSRLDQEDPGEGLAGAGIKSVSSVMQADKQLLQEMTLGSIPRSSLSGEPSLKKRIIARNGSARSPTKANLLVTPSSFAAQSAVSQAGNVDLLRSPDSSSAPAIRKRTLESGSLYAECQIVGTTSAKLSYLISQIMLHQEHEKILIFYQGDNIAYYIAQMLDVLHIRHEIYARSLTAVMKAEYVVRFDQEEQDRVLLMDVRQAAFGLNITSASRIYFINPVCRPSIEAQAVKRAHRIGQTKMVHVETLVLEGTIEEQMLDRSTRMTVDEHRDAKAIEDDVGIRQIIENIQSLTIDQEEIDGRTDMAPIHRPESLWDRPNFQSFLRSGGQATPCVNKLKRSAATADLDLSSNTTSTEADLQVLREELTKLRSDSSTSLKRVNVMMADDRNVSPFISDTCFTMINVET